MELSYGIFIAMITFLFREQIVSLFVTGTAADKVIAEGAKYLSIMAFFYLWPAMTNGFQGYFRGMGRMKMTILGTTSQISIRTLFTILLAQKMGIQGIAYASMIGWSAMLLFEVPIALHELSDMKE